jgi:hypothetical protein
MKKQFFWVMLFSLLSAICFAEAFDDLPYSNPDRWSYFQQEMKAHMRFQADNDVDVLFFMGASGRFSTVKYKEDYLKQLHININPDSERRWKGNEDLNTLFGLQVKLNNLLYVPVIWHYSYAKSYYLLEEYEYKDYYLGFDRKGPMYFEDEKGGSFFAGGLILNTDIIKSGFFLGWAMFHGTSIKTEPEMSDFDYAKPRDGIKAAIVPLVNTSGLPYVGKVLDNILGYIGLGDPVRSFTQAADDYIISDFANSINTNLDFTFTRIDLKILTLEPQIMYARNSYDVAAKNDIYSMKMLALFSNFGLGFTLEGGYKHFFSVSPFFSSDYADTGYFNGSIFYRTKYATFGNIFYYDNIVFKLSFVMILTYQIPSLFKIMEVPFFLTFTNKEYNKEIFDENSFFGGLGIRYRLGF